MPYTVATNDLPRFDVGPAGSYARIFNGAQHDFPTVSLMIAEIQPGEGPAWHRHVYDEVFVISEGEATYTIGNEVITADKGMVVFVPADVPHTYVNSGPGILRQTAVHVAPNIQIEWLDAPPQATAS